MAAGGLLNSIYGSLFMTGLAVVVAMPLGVLAGTYLAEYGRDARVAVLIRLVNDVLLSAPSIVIGLFIYEVMVKQMGHYSGWAGAMLRRRRGSGCDSWWPCSHRPAEPQ